MKYVGTESLFSAIQFVRNGGVSAVMDLKEGSDLLKSLESQVKDRLKEAPIAARACGLHVALTIHGTDDQVVIQRTYAKDDNYKLSEDDHFTIVRTPSALAHDFALGKIP